MDYKRQYQPAILIIPKTVKESTSNAATEASMSNLIGSLKITCKMIDTSYQLSNHAAYQLYQANGLTESDKR